MSRCEAALDRLARAFPPYTNLKEHVRQVTQDSSGQGLLDEFEALEAFSTALCGEDSQWVSGRLAVNRRKNRYQDVLPNESTRFRLKTPPSDGSPPSDYINANLVDGRVFATPFSYIAAQGPTLDTVEDFWRMMWESGSTLVVMLCREKEKGREKCARYWPTSRSSSPFSASSSSSSSTTSSSGSKGAKSGKTAVYGGVQVTVVSKGSLEGHKEVVLRTLQVELTPEAPPALAAAGPPGPRMVAHYQFTGWPDHGLPKSTSALVDLLLACDQHLAAQLPQTAPVSGAFPRPVAVVHCSAGVGRTGVFLASHILLAQRRVLYAPQSFTERRGSSGRSISWLTKLAEALSLQDSAASTASPVAGPSRAQHPFCLVQLIARLRSCRNHLVQTPAQLQYTYSMLLRIAEAEPELRLLG
eukprot:RCo020154